MQKSVTIGIPIYKRLEYLPNVLKVVEAQDYPEIDLLVSDNGMNGTAVSDLVKKHFSKPYRFRQNSATVSGSIHFTQLIEHAQGEYCVILADDDEITPNFVSELVKTLEKHPEASAALGREDTIDEAGNIMRTSKNEVPEVISGPDFIRATWGTRAFGLRGLCTFLGRTRRLLECGGFQDIWKGTSDEDLLMIKLGLNSHIALNTRCSFRKRYYETSMGYAIEMKDLARGIREYLSCLDRDAMIREYAATHSAEWEELRGYLVNSAWNTYFVRWNDLYRRRLSPLEWTKAGFALPPRYYRRVASQLIDATKAGALHRVERHFPQVSTAYRSAKTRLKRNENGVDGA
jgi:glycosyltransferase involved in cell wall biosynthesis